MSHDTGHRSRTSPRSLGHCSRVGSGSTQGVLYVHVCARVHAVDGSTSRVEEEEEEEEEEDDLDEAATLTKK